MECPQAAGSRAPRAARACRALLAGALAIAALPEAARAQTNDVYFRSWRWTNDSADARAASLAGATVALNDESASIEENPAALASLTRSELSLSMTSERRGQTTIGDVLEQRTAAGSLSAALRPYSRLSVALFREEPQVARIQLAPLTAADGARDDGFLSLTTTDVGIALARSFGSHVMLGVGAVHSRLGLAAEYTRVTPPLPAVLEVGSAGGADRYTFNAGLLLLLSPGVQIGLAHRSGTRWELGRVALSPLLSLTLDAAGRTRVVRPATTTLGARLALSRRLALAAQLDHVSSAALSSGVPQGYLELSVPRQSWEPRAALELTLPARSFSVLLRGGAHYQPRPARSERLVPPEPATPGSGTWSPPPPAELFERDPEQALSGRLAARWRLAAGVALIAQFGLRLDLALRRADHQNVLLAGTTWRF